MTRKKIYHKDRKRIACQLEKVENEHGDHNPTEYLLLQNMLLKLGLAAGTIAGTLALAYKIAGGG